MLDEAVGLAATDVLISICHRVRDESLDLDLLLWAPSSESHQRSEALLGKILRDDLSKQELETIPISVQWKSILLLAAQIDLSIADEEDYDDFAHRISPPLQRFCGALFCTSDFILDGDVKYQPLIQQSLLQIFHQQPQNIIWLFLNYRSLFSYSYMFLRRIGKFEKASRQTLEQLFSAKHMTPASEVVSQIDEVEDLKDSDSLIETVMPNIDDDPEHITSHDRASTSNPVEAPKPRPSILIRSNSDAAPQRNLSRSVSFSMDVGREGLAHSEGRRGLIDSIARISTQNLVVLDDNLTESAETAPSISPLSAGDSASSFGLEVEELEDDGDETFILPRNSEPMKPRVLTGARTITSSSILSKSSEHLGSENEPREPFARSDFSNKIPMEDAAIGTSRTPVTSHGEPTSRGAKNTVDQMKASPAIPSEADPEPTATEFSTSGAVLNSMSVAVDISTGTLSSESGAPVMSQPNVGEFTQTEVDDSDAKLEDRASPADFGLQRPKRNSSVEKARSKEPVLTQANNLSIDDEDLSQALIRPQRIESFNSIIPGKEVGRRSHPAELRKLNSSLSRIRTHDPILLF